MNPPPLLRSIPHSSPHPLSLSLQHAFTLHHRRLIPPFSLSIPSAADYPLLTRALAFAVLTQPSLATTHLTHLHALVLDGYALFVSTLHDLSATLYPALLDVPRSQLLWALSHLLPLAAVGSDALVVSLLRNVKAGDFTEPNLWLAARLLGILSNNWDWLSDEPAVLASSLYTFLRLLADHYRLPSCPALDTLKQMEVTFCVRALREHFTVCLPIGRDLIRLLQDLVYIPEFRDVWKDILFSPSKFRSPGFTDVSQLYRARTPGNFFLLRITHEMETQLRFLLTHVKWGKQKRYQVWFAKKHLSGLGSETVIVDIVRFICCAHHPPNEIIQSDVISRWAVIGWLLKCCRKNYVEANVKLALFYDWLFFDERVDNIMNIEPAMLLMVNSVPQYVDLTHTLLEFLFLLVDNYDTQRREVITRGVSTAFGLLVRKGVVHSLDPLTSCSALSPLLRERLVTLAPNLNKGVVKASSDASSNHVVSEAEVAPVC